MTTTIAQQKREAATSVIKQAAAICKTTFIARDMIGGFTGGALSPRYLANLDSQGVGPKGAFKLGRRQCYPIDSLVAWLISRLEV